MSLTEGNDGFEEKGAGQVEGIDWMKGHCLGNEANSAEVNWNRTLGSEPEWTDMDEGAGSATGD